MPSPAQYIPTLALEKIIDYTVGVLPKREYDRCDCDCDLFLSIAAMLSLCRHWRQVALDRLYQEVWWCTVSECDVCCKNRCCNRSLPWSLDNTIETGNLARVKTVRLHWENSVVLDGSAIGFFRAPHIANLAIPSVSTLVLELDNPRYMEDNSLLDATEYADVYCSELNRVFPNAKNRKILDLVFFQNHLDKPFVRNLVSGLFAQATSISAVPLQEHINHCMFDNISTMRSLEFGNLCMDSSAIQVIRRNCLSLERLQIGSRRHELFTKIVCAEDGAVIEYPRVSSLVTSFFPPHWPRNRVIGLDSPAGAPFPGLQRLVCEGGYPFANDVLFSGNRATLEYLDISVSVHTFATLKKYSVFSPGRFTSLGYICASVVDYGQMDTTYFETVRGVLMAGANATTMKYAVAQSCLFKELGMSVRDIGHNVTYLNMPKIQFTLQETLQLIKAVPHLRQLSTDIHVTDELRINSLTHGRCRGLCYLDWEGTVGYSEDDGDDDDDSNSDTSSDASFGLYDDYLDTCGSGVYQLQGYMADHLPYIYQDLDFVDELYKQYYPLSTTLAILDGSTNNGDKLFAQCRMLAILVALCPSIRRVQAGWIDDTNHLSTRRDITRYMSREGIEGTDLHAGFARRLQSIQL